MFVLKKIFQNLMRRKLYALLMLVFAILLTMLLLVYSRNYLLNYQEYQKICRTIPISGKVINRTNTMDAGLTIMVEQIEKLAQRTSITDIQKTAFLRSYESDAEHRQRPSINIKAVNTIRCLPAVNPESIEFFGAFGLDDLEGSENYAIVRRDYLEEKGLALNDEYEIRMFYPEYEAETGGQTFDFTQLADVSVRIIGAYDAGVLVGNPDSNPQLIIPVAFYCQICTQSELAPYYDSYSFTLTDSGGLNEFKAAARELKFASMSQSVKDSDFRLGDTLLLNDKVFMESASYVLRNHKLYVILYPVLFLIAMLLSFTISYISIQNRRTERKLLYAIGVRPWKAAGIFLGEKAVILLSAFLIVLFIFFLFTGQVQSMLFLFLLFYFISDCAGAVFALLLSNKGISNLFREE